MYNNFLFHNHKHLMQIKYNYQILNVGRIYNLRFNLLLNKAKTTHIKFETMSYKMLYVQKHKHKPCILWYFFAQLTTPNYCYYCTIKYVHLAFCMNDYYIQLLLLLLCMYSIVFTTYWYRQLCTTKYYCTLAFSRELATSYLCVQYIVLHSTLLYENYQLSAKGLSEEKAQMATLPSVSYMITQTNQHNRKSSPNPTIGNHQLVNWAY